MEIRSRLELYADAPRSPGGEKIQQHTPRTDEKPCSSLHRTGSHRVGVCDALHAGDGIVGTYRSHGIYLARSEDVEGMFAELYGRTTGPGKGKAGSMHLAKPSSGVVMTSAVVGTTIPVALGIAWANRVKRNGRLAVALATARPTRAF